jgi:hypothetical protein
MLLEVRGRIPSHYNYFVSFKHRVYFVIDIYNS